MAQYRKVDCRFHLDAKIKRLSPEGKLVFLTLLTHPETGVLGIFKGLSQTLSEATGIPFATVDQLLRGGELSPFFHVDDDWKIIIVKHWFRYHPPTNQNQIVGLFNAFDLLPETRYAAVIWDNMNEELSRLTGKVQKCFERLAKPLANRFVTLAKDLPSETEAETEAEAETESESESETVGTTQERF